MGQALYRKYRSKTLGEIVGQEHITKTLEQALASGRISHAYLFTGPHGVGKTSIARILAHEVNGLPYTDDSSHIDIIEIDAASNRRIDEIRDLREKVYIAPTSAKYKVYIIDEVHMLTREAFNALLKTLEEPPAHVIFILATTDAHKLPETIISRTQRFTFKPVEPAKVVAHLKYIAKQEGLSVSDDALELLARHGGGSFRDSISLLDQAAARGSKLSTEDVLVLLGIPPAAGLNQVLAFLTSRGQPKELFESLGKLYAQGYQAAAIAKQLAQVLREQLVSNHLLLPPDMTLKLLRELIEVPASSDPERLLEIVLLQNGQAGADQLPQRSQTSLPQAQPEAKVAPTVSNSVAKKVTGKQVPLASGADSVEQTTSEPSSPKPAKASSGAETPPDSAAWAEILTALKRKHNTLYSVARMAQPEFTDDTLKLLFSFPFHQKRLNEAKNRQMLSEVVEQATGRQLVIECLVDKNAAPYQTKASAVPAGPETESKSDLVAISNIFGGGELLES